jgi:hypothetical protein
MCKHSLSVKVKSVQDGVLVSACVSSPWAGFHFYNMQVFDYNFISEARVLQFDSNDCSISPDTPF